MGVLVMWVVYIQQVDDSGGHSDFTMHRGNHSDQMPYSMYNIQMLARFATKLLSQGCKWHISKRIPNC